MLNCNRFYHIRGGADAYFLALDRLLKKSGHGSIPFVMKDEKNIDSEFNDYFINYLQFLNGKKVLLKNLARGIYSFEAKNKVNALVKKTGPDIAHIHNIRYQLTPSILPALKRHNLPIVMTVNDYKLLCPAHTLFSNKRICHDCQGLRYYNAVFRRCFKDSYSYSLLVAMEMYLNKLSRIYEKNVDIFIAPSIFLKNKMIEFGFDSRKISILPYFIETDDYAVSSENRGYFVYLGRLEKTKGVDILLNAIQKSGIAKKYELKIIGDGTEKENLMQYCVDNGINNIKFYGFLPQDQVKDIIKYSIMTIVPSVWYEVFGIIILESFAMGKPVIASRIGGIPEVVTENKDGLLFDPGNVDDLMGKIEYCLMHQGKMAEMGEEGRKKVEKFYNSRIHLNGLLNIYGEALKKSSL